MLTQPLSFDAIQKTLSDRVASHLSPGGTTVVLPSLSFPTEELAKITAIERYEERLLSMLLRLRHPEARIIYLTSLPIDPGVIDYYLSFLPDPADARERLSLIDLGHFTGRGLAADLADDRGILARVRAAVGDDGAVILPFNVTDAERRVAVEVGAPLFAVHPELVALGSKTGSRRAAAAVGVPVLPGVEDLWSTDAISAAVDELRLRHPGVDGVVVKLNNGFSGQGNAIVSWSGDQADLADRRTEFCAAGETWESFAAKIAREGAIVEQLVTRRSASPSAQAWISPGGELRIASTHDQLLGGPGGHVYLGCRYPADPAYRQQIIAHTEAVGRHLADAGATGPFAIDFIVVDDGSPRAYLSEINLRLGGTTHPFEMACMALGAGAEPAADGLDSPHGTRVYIASDNITEAALVGRSPSEVIARVHAAGLALDPATHTGVTLHLLGAVTRYGKLGAVAIAPDHVQAEQLYADLLTVLHGDR